MYYTNGSAITKTFHGVTFRPGETKAVSGIINDPTFYKSSKRQEPPKRARRKNSTDDSIKITKKQEKEVALEDSLQKDFVPLETKDAKSSDNAKESEVILAES